MSGVALMSGTNIDGVEYGPLAVLFGVWRGDSGMDIAPVPDDDEHNPYYETITFEAAGDVTNAEEQVLSIVRYHQQVSRKSNDEVFHDQIGYWLWDPATDTVIQTLTIPRAVTLLAGGVARNEGEETVLEVSATAGDAQWGILQAPFMQAKATTTGYSHCMKVSGNSMRYSQTTVLEIYGKHDYQHTDENSLTRQ
jgi:hypothetical protein